MEDVASRKAELVVAAARKHKAFDLVLLKVDRLSSIADYFFICSCKSSRQAQAVSDQIVEGMKKEGGFSCLGVEGRTQGHWVLLDYGEVICHVFYEPIRSFYDLDGLWHEAERTELDDAPPARVRSRRKEPAGE